MQNNNNNIPNDHALPKIVNKTWTLDQPDLEEVGSVLQQYLSAYFNYFDVNVVQCPNLTVGPYNLPTSGLCGGSEVIEFGNHKHLYDPSKHKEVSWDVMDFIDQCEKTSFIIGGSMCREIPNKEVIMNFLYSEKGVSNEIHYLCLSEREEIVSECLFNSYVPFCDLYGSFYVCNGEQGKVLEVYAKEARYSDVQILNLMRNALCCRYFNAHVGLSGLLVINNGTIEATVMPRTFSQTLLKETEEIDKWNHKYNISAPNLIVHNTMFNFNELDVTLNEGTGEGMSCTVNESSSQILRANNYIGGRFLSGNNDSLMEYRGYFNVVTKLHRVGAELTRSQVDS